VTFTPLPAHSLRKAWLIPSTKNLVPEYLNRDEGMALMQGSTLAHGKAGKRFPARVGSTA
jgi:hypothetical protein